MLAPLAFAPYFYVLLMLALPLLMRLAITLSAHRICVRLDRFNRLVCPHCGSILQSDDANATCPQCTNTSTIANVQRTWRRWKPVCWDIDMRAKDDAVLRIGGPSAGTDTEVERIRSRGGTMFGSIDDVPRGE